MKEEHGEPGEETLGQMTAKVSKGSGQSPSLESTSS